MEILKAEILAKELFQVHGLLDWTLVFDNAKRRLGQTSYQNKKISLSKSLTILNPEEQVKDTILHEIAHALVGSRHGHDNVWREKAISIGCNGERTTSSIVKVPAKYTITCTLCNSSWQAHRLFMRRIELGWHKQCGRVSQGRLSIKENLL